MSKSRSIMPTGPPNLGLAMPTITATVSPVAAIVRAAAITADISSYELPARPRSVINQQNLPCCVSCALAGAMEMLNPRWPALAPLFHYHVTRFEERGANSEGFLRLDNSLITLTTTGICREDLHRVEFTEPGAATKPSPQARADALTRALGLAPGPRRRFRFAQRDEPSTVNWIRKELRQDRPVVIGIQLPMNYPDSFLDSDFAWLDPDASPRSASGHCVLAIGYNDARRSIHIQDSRGANRFEGGRWWMGYRVVDSSIVLDAYSLTP